MRLDRRTALGLAVGTAVGATAAPMAGAADRAEVLIWPQGMPEPVVPANPPERIEKGADGTGRRFDISRPRLFVFPPSGGARSNGAGVVVVPGGGFTKLADEHEGSEACEFLAKHGFTAFLLVHRCPTDKHADPSLGPAQDVQKAIQTVRQRAGDWGLGPNRVGLMGFSAGGQVSVIGATNNLLFSGGDAAVSHKPDFMLLLYPWKIYDPATRGLRADIHPDAGLPPTFICQMGDDTGSLPQGSTLLYLELINRKIPAELHIYEKGGHGFGMRSRPGSAGPSDWPTRALDWLRIRGLLTP